MSDYHVDSVSYFRVEGFEPELFRCGTWRANLAVPFCAGRWREAQAARGERAEELRLCASCPIGATHAGERFVPRAANYQNNVCARCQKGSGRRLILGRLCVGCYNRQREWLVGKNAKGTVPVKAAEELAYRTLALVLAPGEPTARIVEFTEIAIGEPELRLSVGRVHLGQVEFLGLVPRGTYPSWRPDGLGGLKAIVAPPAAATSAPRPAPTPEAPGERRSAAGSRLRLAALSTSSLAGLRPTPFLRSPVLRRPAPFTRDRLLAA